MGRNNPGYEYRMEGVPLKQTEEEVDIGVTMTKNLKPDAQCRKAARTAQTVLSQVSRAFHFRDRHVFVKLYTTYVRPHLEFSVPVWSPQGELDKEYLEKVQRRAVGMVTGLRGNSYEERLEELGLTTLEERRHQLDMLQTYKIVHGKDKVNRDTWFRMVGSSDRGTRAASDPLNMRIPAPRTELRKMFFSQRVPTVWNQVPAAIKAARTAGSFKRLYRAHRSELRSAAR